MVEQDLRKWTNYSVAQNPRLSTSKPKPMGDPGPKRPLAQSPIVEKAASTPQPKASPLDEYANVPQYETPISDTEGLRRAYEQGDDHLGGE